MKVSGKIVQQLRSVLIEYVNEFGEHTGKYMFSKEMGMIENQLYNEVNEQTGIFVFEQLNHSANIFTGDVEGELDCVEEDATLLPFLEVV